MQNFKNQLLVINLFILLSLPNFSWAKSFFVAAPRGSSASQEEKDAIRDLISTHLEEDDDHTLTTERNNAAFIIKSKVVKLGSSYVVSLYKYKGKKRIHKAKLKAAQFDEMDVIIQRLTHSVLNEVSAKKSIKVGQVTQNEQKQIKNRREALTRWQFSMGPAWPENLNAARPGIHWGLGYSHSVTTDWDLNILTHILTAVESAKDTSFYDISLGANYYFSEGDNAPFVGAQFGYGGAAAHEENSEQSSDPLTELWGDHISDDDVSGMLISAVAGFGFFRASSVSAGIEFRYSKFFNKTKKSEQQPALSSLSILIQH